MEQEVMDRLQKLEERTHGLLKELAFAKGKALGLEASLLTLARHWGKEPQTVIEALHQTMETLDEPNKNPGLAGVQKDVAMRLVEQISSALHSRNR